MKFYGLLILLFAGSSLQGPTPLWPTYEAGVVEFNYERNGSIPEVNRTASNINSYLNIMATAPSTLDIIIFPEMTLNNIASAVEIPEPKDAVSPCENFPDNLVKQFSCSAKTYQRYVVVNIVTKVSCPDDDMIAFKDPRNCSDRADGFSYYNTNVVFDRDGKLISRYRKYNLFGEAVDKPYKPTLITFETDFGVKFGHFICFDLMFKSPALDLVRKENITDVIFTTMWFSEMPFLTAVQIQQNWAYANNVNFLAAGANHPEYGSTGTGIFAARQGSLISTMEGKTHSALYTATIPKRNFTTAPIVESHVRYTKEEMSTLKLKRDQLDPYEIVFLEDHQMTPDTSIQSTVCHSDLCCDFYYSYKYVSTDKPYYKYALAVYHGNRTFDGFADGGVAACAVLACTTRDVATCGIRNETLEFAYEWYGLEVKGRFPFGDEFFFLPTSLDESIMPFGVAEFDYQRRTIVDQNNTASYTNYDIIMKSVVPQGGSLRNFYTFGIYGRDFNLDDDTTAAAGTMHVLTFMVLATASFLTLKSFQ